MPNPDGTLTIEEALSEKEPEAGRFLSIDEALSEGGISPYEQHVGEQSGTTPRTRLEVAAKQAQEKAQFKTMGKTAAGAAIVGGASMLGGMPLAAVAPEGYGVIAGITGQTAGAASGELLRQKVFGEQTSLRDAASAALFTAAPALVGYIGTRVLGAAGGVPPSASEYVGARSRLLPRYDLTMAEPKTTAELSLGRKIGKEVVGQAKTLTPGRIAEAEIIKESTEAGTKIDPQSIIDTIKSKMLKTPKTASGRNYNKRLDELANSLEATKSRGGVTPEELDELIGGELDPSIYRTGKPSSKMTAKGLVPAREAARKSLLGALPPEAGIERARAAQELSRRELAAGYFGLEKNEKTVVNQIRNLFEPGNEGALESLRGIGQQAGIDFEAIAKELSVKRAFTADDRVKAGMLHRIMLTIGFAGMASGRPGFGIAALASQPAVSRMGAKLTAPLQLLLGPVGATMSELYKHKYPPKREAPKVSPTSQATPQMWKETQVSPEQMFPGMTNVGQSR